MGLFKSLFGKKEQMEQKKEQISWKPLVSIEQLDEIVMKSESKTQMVFKHSTTCGISSMVLRMFSNNFAFNEETDLYILDLHAHRDVSDTVESKFQVLHQSPQLLIIKKGNLAFHASHGAIVDADLGRYI